MAVDDFRIRRLADADHDDLFASFSSIVDAGEGFPQAPPVTRAEFDEYWIEHTSAVFVAEAEGSLAGAYYLKPNFVGRAAHIANAGYFVARPFRGRGLGRRLVEDSFTRAVELGFDALMFNLVFKSNPARRLYEALGFRAVGRVPAAVEGEDAVIYWRSVGPGR